jgi:gliding motility-associated lipoprotein GldD
MKKTICFYFLSLVFAALFFISCNSNYTVGKKKGYFRIDLPEKKYQVFDQPGYPYTFEYPVYANIIKDTTFFEDKPENPWWLNIDVPRLGARIYISYKEIGSRNKFDSLVNDAFKMAYKKHADISTGIVDSPMTTPNKVEGIYFSLAGNTATASQFFLTDSTKHFLRGALYFDATPNEDSLGIVNKFLQEDMKHLINTFRWKIPGTSPKID